MRSAPVELDPERAPLVKLAFDAFATGEYSISSLRDLLDEAGLRTPMTPKRAPAPLSRANVHYMLRRDYYVGVVTWRGAKNINGRHPALIDDETFEKVQIILKAHAHSGDRTHKHQHYLKGSIYCGHCGRRLIFSRVRGRAGTCSELLQMREPAAPRRALRRASRAGREGRASG